MSVASGSSSCGNAFRSAVRTGKIHRGGMRISRGSVSISQDRNFSDQVSATHYPTSSSSSSSSPPPLSDRTAYPIKPNRGSSNLTGQAASEHLKELFNLPDSHTFSPKLSLQMFTHKSYRYNYLPKRITHEPSEEEKTQKHSQHNERLSFTGRRAIFTYFTIFLHATANINPTVLVPGSGFLKRNESLMGRLENLFHVTQTSQLVGSAWGTNELTRWDKNPLLDGSKANATTVQAIIGGIYNEFGSPAAHRAFHLHYLPNLVDQLRDPMVKERVEIIRRDLEDQFGKGIIVGQK